MDNNKQHKEYLTYITKYLGVALIAGSAVHIDTLQTDFTRYLILGLLGLTLMLAGNIYEAVQKKQKIDLNYLFIVSGLSIATGFFSGGIQHYLDNPSYAGTLLGIGIFVAYVTYFIKEHFNLKINNIIYVGLFSVLIILLSNYYFDDKILGDNHHGNPNLQTDMH